MTFEDRPINHLGQVEAKIFNEGSEVVQNPTLTFSLPLESTVLAAAIRSTDFEAEPTVEGNRVSIRLPYLNAVSDHRQVVDFSIWPTVRQNR